METRGHGFRDRVPGLVVFHSAGSLRRQIAAWSARHPACRVEWSAATSLPGIRRVLRHADAVVLDATENAEARLEAFCEAVDRLGAYRVAVYSERMQQWFERFVRTRGSLLLFGPMHAQEWDGFFEGMLRQAAGRPGGTAAAGPEKMPVRAGDAGSREPTFGTWPLAGWRRPKTGTNYRLE